MASLKSSPSASPANLSRVAQPQPWAGSAGRRRGAGVQEFPLAPGRAPLPAQGHQGPRRGCHSWTSHPSALDGLPAKTQTCTRFTAASLGSSLFTHTSVRSCGWSDTKRVCCSLQGQICWHDPLLPAGSRCLICCNTHFSKPLQRLPFPEVSLPHAVISEVWGFVHVHAEERV